MKLEQLGEFGLIEIIKQSLPPASKDVLVGIGDDVAVVRCSDGNAWLLTCDVQVEGSHFTRAMTSPNNLGRKALAINQSDIAAAGGRPRFALVSLGLPTLVDSEFVEEMYSGLRAQAEEFGTEIVGGNISRTRQGFFIDIFLLGESPISDILLRSGAHPGDKILVTGTLGDAAAGVALLTGARQDVPHQYVEVAISRYRLPTPRVREGLVISTSHWATAMTDISDGLAGDLAHICEMSNVGCQVFASALPVSPENRDLAHARSGDDWQLALHGGEDYELLFTAAPEYAQLVSDKISMATGTRVSIIGDILPPQAGRLFELPNGDLTPLEPKGWDHFRS